VTPDEYDLDPVMRVGAASAAATASDPRPRGLLARLSRMLRTRLWTVDSEVRARQRLRLFVAAPFAAIAGLAWGTSAAESLVGGAAFWAVLGALSFPLFLYVQQRLIGPVGRLVDQRWPQAGGFAGLAWEALSVGALVFLLTDGLGAPLVPAVGTALGVGAFYVMATEYLVGGTFGSHVSLLLHGGSAGGGARRHEGYSYAESLVARGRTSEAMEAYRQAIAQGRRSAVPYLRLSTLLASEGEPEQAVRVLRHARTDARLDEEGAAAVVRSIYMLCSRRLGEASTAREDLEWLIDRHRRSEHATWARRRLREIRRGEAP
jgi:hypothetical protein